MTTGVAHNLINCCFPGSYSTPSNMRAFGFVFALLPLVTATEVS